MEYLRRAPHVRSISDDDCAILLNLQNGRYYSLNGSGAVIFEIIATNQSIGDIVDKLSADYEVEPSRLQQDVLAFIDYLRSNNLVEVSQQ
jgi:Coenzyme PQQ synthesis protein D (PqqD)